MANLNPVLLLVWQLKRNLSSGKSLRNGIESYLGEESGDELFKILQKWWLWRENGGTGEYIYEKSIHLTYLFSLLDAGLRGQAILLRLSDFESILLEKCEEEIQLYVESLPSLMILPLLLFIFPAIMFLLLPPLIKMLTL